jgi:cytochrome c oxidase subunit 2
MKKVLFALGAFLLTSIAITSTAHAVGAPTPWGWDLQLAHGEFGDRLRGFHTYLMYIITAITVFVLGVIFYIVVKFNRKRNPKPADFTHNTLLEIIWTVVPIIIVIAIMVPSLKLLYFVDKTEKADLTVKVTGYQWYWGYEYPDYGVTEFESRMIPTNKLKAGELRLFEVDEPLVVPVGKTVRVLLTGDPNGVIHAWGVPALGFKRDTIPGRMNEGWFRIEKPGVYYGACYELCGPDHSQMPVKVIGVTEEEFAAWVASKGGKMPTAEVAAAPSAEAAPTPATTQTTIKK